MLAHALVTDSGKRIFLITYQYDKPVLRVRCVRNAPGIPSDLPRKSRSSTDDRSYPNEDHSNPLLAVAAAARPIINVSAASKHLKKQKKKVANHCFRVFDMDHTHPFDLLRREKTKLDFLDRAQRRLGVWEVNVRHDGG